jgi:hypothetical protein
MTVTEPRSQAAEFVDFFDRGWRIGAGPKFFDHFLPRIHPDVLLTQPLAPAVRGRDQFRAGFEPVFRAIPDLHGAVTSWGETADGVLVELPLSGHIGGRPVKWTTVDRIVLADGMIKERHANFDPTPLLIGLVLRPHVSLPLLPSLLRRKR